MAPGKRIPEETKVSVQALRLRGVTLELDEMGGGVVLNFHPFCPRL